MVRSERMVQTLLAVLTRPLDVLPIIQSGLESHTHAIVDKSLSCLSTMLAVLDFSTIKSILFPG